MARVIVIGITDDQIAAMLRRGGLVSVPLKAGTVVESVRIEQAPPAAPKRAEREARGDSLVQGPKSPTGEGGR